MSFDFTRAYVVRENQRAMGFMPIDLDHPSVDLFWGTTRPVEPVRLRQHLGSAIADLMMAGDPALLTVSQLVVDVLSGIRATGWSTYPVECRTRRGELVAGRYGLAVVGRCGPVLWDRSERTRVQLASGAPPAPQLRGLYFDDDSWDGSDVFSPAGTTMLLITHKVYAALRGARVRNFAFQRLTDYVSIDVERMLAEDDRSERWRA